MDFLDLIKDFNDNVADIPKREEILKKMWTLASDDEYLKGKVFCYEAQIYYYKEEYLKMVESCNNCLKRCEKALPCQEVLYIYNYLGIYNSFIGNTVATISYYINAIEYAEKNNFKENIAIVYNNIGSIFTDIGNYKYAIDYLAKALEISETTPQRSTRAYSYTCSNLFRCYNGLNDTYAMENILKEWKEIIDEKGICFSRELGYYNHCLLMLYSYDKDKSLFKKQFEKIMTDLRNDFDFDIIDETILGSRFWIKRGFIEESKVFLDFCLTVIDKYKVNNIKRNLYYSLIKYYEAIGDDINKEETVNKYYEMVEENRAELQAINAKNIIDRLEYFELQKQINNAQKSSLTDTLTGLYNRRMFKTEIVDKFKILCSLKQSIAIVFIDVDNFKEYNDTFGHLEGDNALKLVATQIKNIAVEDGIIPIRYGGDEFLIFISNKNEDEVKNIVQLIHNGVKDKKLANPLSKDEILTISVGVAYKTLGENDDIYSLIIDADRCLYQSKIEKNTITSTYN